MAIVSDIEIRLRADIARLQQDMTRARQTVSSFTEDAKKMLFGFAAGFSLKALATEVISAQREFDKLNSSLYTATGSATAAAGAFKALQAFAASTPYSVSEATEAFIKLRNLGLTPSERALGSYGNTAAAMGKGLNQMIEAVADAATGEFERLKEFGIKSKQNGDKVLFTFQGVTKSIGNNAKDIEKYLMAIGETEFAGAMERRANTLDGAISNLGDTWASTMRAIASNGFGEGVMAGVLALSGALTDLVAIMDAVGGAAHKEGEQVTEAAGLHKALTTVFETVAVLGLNVAYVFTSVGKELGGLAAQAAAVAKGDFAGAKAIHDAMIADADADRAAVDAKSAAILGAADKAQVARDKEAADIKQKGTDRLAGYAKEISADEKRNQAMLAVLDITNKLNGVDKDTAGNLVKLKTALDTGAISQAEYNKYMAQIAKETTEASTAYKNQVKALDLSADAIKRRSDAQAAANAQDAEHLAFLNRTGQLNDNDFTAQKGALELKTLESNRAALEAVLALEKKRIDNKAKIADVSGQIAAADKAIDAKKLRNDEAIFEIEQKQYREAVGHTADLIDAARDQTQAQKDKTRDMQDEIDTLGMTGVALAQVTAARLRDQAVALDRRAEIGMIDEVNESLRQQAEELRKQADLGLTKARVEEQQKFWGSIEQTAHDTFISIADGGKDTFTRLRDSAKNIFFEWLYQMTVKKWIINVGASFDGSAATAAISSLSSSGSSTSSVSSATMLQAGSAIYKAISGGFASLSTSVADAVQSGMYSTGMSTSIASNGSFATGAGSAASVAAGMVGGHYLGNAISGGIGIGQHEQAVNNTGMVIGTGIGYYVGGTAGAALGALIGGAAGGLVNRIFGMGSKQYSDTSTINGTLGSGMFSGTVDTPWTQKGGWFHSDKSGTDKNAIDPTVAGTLSKAYDVLKAASSDYATTLGLDASTIATRTQVLSIALGKDDAANQEAITKFFVGVSDSIAAELLPGIAQFQMEGETASATLQRLATDFKTVDGIFAAIGQDASKAFNLTGVAAIQARERLIALAGGVDALASQTTFYYQNFLTDSERALLMQKPLQDSLTALGFAGITTAEQFKDAVNGLVASGALATEEGAKQYAGLLALAPQFKTVADYLKDVSDTAAQTAKDLSDAAVQSARDGAGAAFDALQRSVTAQKNAAQTAFDSLMAGIEKRIDLATTRVSDLQSLSSSLRSTNLPGTTMDRATAQAQITTALAIARASGVLPKADDLQGALSALGDDVSDTFASFADAQRDQLRTANSVEELSGLTDGQLTVAQQTLDALNAQKADAQTAYDAQIAGLDRIAEQAQLQIDAINGVDNSVIGLGAAFTAFTATINAALGNKTIAAQTSITPEVQLESLYNNILGRTSDAAGFDFYLQGLKSGATDLAGVALGMKDSVEYQSSHPPVVADTQGYGTMSGISTDQQTLNAQMQTSLDRTAAAVEQLASQFNQVSAGGNSLLTVPA